jgi:hypothetical protein
MPTPERSNHGIVERLEPTISDSSGRPARPYRFVDTLAVMERRGSITAGMRQAGEDFRDCFAVAQLDPLSAFDISRPKIGSRSGVRPMEGPGSRIENARRVVGMPPLPLAASAQPAVRVSGMWSDGNNR